MKTGLEALLQTYGSSFAVTACSVKEKKGIEDLRQRLFEVSRVVRVYSKEPGKAPDMKTPFTLLSGSTVLDLAKIIHKDFVKHLKYACIWGSGKFDGQRVQKDYVLHDRDIVEYHVK